MFIGGRGYQLELNWRFGMVIAGSGAQWFRKFKSKHRTIIETACLVVWTCVACSHPTPHWGRLSMVPCEPFRSSKTWEVEPFEGVAHSRSLAFGFPDLVHFESWRQQVNLRFWVPLDKWDESECSPGTPNGAEEKAGRIPVCMARMQPTNRLLD